MRFHYLRITVRRIMVVVVVAALVLSYVVSYYRISRRGFREAADYGISGFLYVPMAEAAAREGLSWHYALAIGYAPLNWIDRFLFGAPGPAGCIMRLSG